MRTAARWCLVTLLVLALVELPAFASSSAPLGQVLQAHRARLGPGDAMTGATVFDGDRLYTAGAGALRVRLGSAQIYLQPNTTAVLHRTPSGASATLESGTVVFSSSGAGTFELLAAEARIRPLTVQPTIGQITLVSPTEYIISSQRGQLEVTLDGEVHTVPEATAYRVVADPAVQGPRGVGGKLDQQPRPAGKKKRFLFFLLFFTGAGTGVGIWRALISPEDP